MRGVCSALLGGRMFLPVPGGSPAQIERPATRSHAAGAGAGGALISLAAHLERGLSAGLGWACVLMACAIVLAVASAIRLVAYSRREEPPSVLCRHAASNGARQNSRTGLSVKPPARAALGEGGPRRGRADRNEVGTTGSSAVRGAFANLTAAPARRVFLSDLLNY